MAAHANTSGVGPGLTRHGTVAECRGEAIVRFAGGCGLGGGGCAACSGLAAGVAEIPLRRLQGAGDLRPGEAVIVRMAPEALTRVAVRVFGLPVAALLAGAWLGGMVAEWLTLPRSMTAAVVGLACLGGGLLLGARWGAAAVDLLKLVVYRDRTNR